MAAIALKKSVDAEDTDTWLTPKWVLSELGRFDLDPCAAELNPGWTGAAIAFTEHQDGLSQEWHGRVFMNPPFSDTARWIEKHAAHGSGISLVPATVESTSWRDNVWPRAQAILLTAGRIRFCRPDGSTTTGRPLRSIALIGWGAEDRRILENCAIAGVLLTEWAQRPIRIFTERRAEPDATPEPGCMADPNGLGGTISYSVRPWPGLAPPATLSWQMGAAVLGSDSATLRTGTF